MSTTRVLHLDAFRGRRRLRAERVLTLLRPDAVRHGLAELLAEAKVLVAADRAAVLWLDEFGPMVPRAHVLFDLHAHPARREFDARSLQTAWRLGVPGLVDAPELSRGRVTPDAPRSAVYVGLGSDGLRTWFLALDSVTPRAALDDEVRERLLHLAGRCTTLLLHRELVPGDQGPGRADGFTGWTVLADAEIEGAAEDRITERFLVIRLVRAYLDDDLAPDMGLMQERVSDLRAEVGDSEEGPYWSAILDAAGAGDLWGLARAVVDAGVRAENLGELEGALEAFRSGYWVAALSGAGDVAVEAARFLARGLRRAGRWDDSERWYAHAAAVARAMDDPAGEALALDGQAATLRARGNMPDARRCLEEALTAAELSGDAHAVGSVNMHLMTFYHLAGQGSEAVLHGWTSVRAFETTRDQLRALVALAGILMDLGAVEVAEEAYAVALERVEESYFKAFALEGYAHAAALRGDREAYEVRYRDVLAEAWAAGGVDFQAQALLYRGRAYTALGEPELARQLFQEALAFAEERGLNAYVFQAEDGLRALDGAPTAEPERTHSAIGAEALEEVRGGLGTLRRELTGAAV